MIRVDPFDLIDPERIQPHARAQLTLRSAISSAVVNTAPDRSIEDHRP